MNGASDGDIGVISGFFVLAYAFAAVFFGARSDKWGRKRVILLSYLTAAATSVAYLVLLLFANALPSITILCWVFILRILDGWFLGAFWPPLQGRLCESPEWNDRRLRFYNLAWSVGIIVSNVILSAATVVDPVPAILYPVLGILIVICEGILSVNVIIILVKLQDVPKQCPPEAIDVGTPENHLTGMKKHQHSKQLSPRVKIAMLAMLGYGLFMATLFTNIFNQFSQISIATAGTTNLIPWVTVLDNVRFSTQLVIFGIAKTPARPKQRFLTLCGTTILLLMGLAFASEFLLQTGILNFVPLIGFAGIVLGLFYANGFGVIMGEARPDNRGYYQGLLEMISNLGYFAGVILSASISGILGYFASYAIVAVCVLGLLGFIVMIPVTKTSEI